MAAWLYWDRTEEPIYNRGHTPLTHETNLGKIWLADREVEHMLAPNVDASLTNEEGEPVNYRSVPVGSAYFRDDGVQPPVFAVAVGDSFTFGHEMPLKDCWVEKTESLLKADVVNLGVTNIFGSTQIQRTLERHGLPLKPKLVIWAAFVNDWYEDTLFHSWELIAPPLKGQIDFPRSRSVYDAMRRHIYKSPPTEPNGLAREPPLDAIVVYTEGALKLTFDATSYAAQNLDIPAISNGWATSQTAMLRAAKAARDAGAEMIVMTIPAKESVYHSRAREVLAYAKVRPDDVFCATIESFCRENNIRCLNLLPVLRPRADAGDQLYFGRDGHFNRLGNAVVAEALVEFLKAEELLPESAHGD